MRQNRDSALWIAVEKPQDELVDQCGLSRTARTGETDYPRICVLRFAICDFGVLRLALHVWRYTFGFVTPYFET